MEIVPQKKHTQRIRKEERFVFYSLVELQRMGQQLPTLPLGENSAEELISCINRVQNCVLAMIFGGRRDFEGALEEVADADVYTVRNVLGTSQLAK